MNTRAETKYMWAISICALVAIFSSTLSKTPTLPLFASHLGSSDAQVGWIAAASTVPGILLSYLAGVQSDRYGWKRILFISLFIFATAPFLYLLVQNPLHLTVVRFYHGFATAIFGPVAMAAIASFSGGKKGEMLSLYSSSTIVGRALAPFAGGFLMVSWGFTGVFWICAFFGTVAFVIGFVFWGRSDQELNAPEPVKQLKGSQSWGSSLRSLLGHRELMQVGLLEAAVFFTYGALEIIFPLYAKGQGMSVWQIGVIMGLQLVGVILFKPVFGRLSDRVGRMPVILAGLVVCAISITGIAFWYNHYGIGLLNIGFGLGFALVTSSTRPLAADLVRNGHFGASLGMLSTLMDMGQVAGPPTIGMISTFIGYQAGFLMLVALLVIVLVICYPMIKKQPPKIEAPRST